MAVGDAVTLAVAAIIVLLGGRAVVKQTWDAWIKPLVSSLYPPVPTEIMSNREIDTPSVSISPRTDAPPDGRTHPTIDIIKPVMVDTARLLRAHGFTRDEARALLKTLGWSLGNDTWARAQPDEDDEIVTPYAGRVTSRKYYPENPELEYKAPES